MRLETEELEVLGKMDNTTPVVEFAFQLLAREQQAVQKRTIGLLHSKVLESQITFAFERIYYILGLFNSYDKPISPFFPSCASLMLCAY